MATISPLQPHEDIALTEDDLRELYDNEEIDRFLRLFSAHVTEVHAIGNSSPQQSNSTILQEGFNSVANHSTSQPVNESLLVQIVREWIIPNLPPPRPPPQEFTLGGLRLTIERLFIAVEPVYLPFLVRMTRLAMWKDKKASCLYCTLYWILWHYDVILPALLLRIIYALFARKILQHPTLAELQDHRLQVTRATELGDALSSKFSASSSFGPKEIWRIVKIVNKTAKQRTKSSSKAKATKADAAIEPEDTVAVEEEQTEELKRFVLNLLHQIADFHERIKNIVLWRRPTSSWFYAVILSGIFFTVLLLPAKYLNKLAYFVVGFIFWHVVPVLAAIPPSDRRRLPVPFADVPTDADYAMELISQRSSTGLTVTPAKTKKQDKQNAHFDPSQRPSETSAHSVDWKKWGDRAAYGKSWADERLINRLRTRQTNPAPNLPPRRVPLPSSIIESEHPSDNHTYPVQHASGPGLVALTSNDLRFTPVMSLEPKIIIPLSKIQSVKKTGLLKGLLIRAVISDGEREEKFRWVGGRDELFARLVGAEGRRWMRT